MDSTSNQAGFFNKLIQPLMAVGSTAVLSQLLVMLQNLIIARWVGPEQNGYILTGFNVAALGFILVNWGFDHWLLQRTSIDEKSSHRNLGLVMSTKLVLGLLLSVGLLVLLPSLRPTIYLPYILALCLLDTLVESLSNSAYTYYLATNRFNQSSLIVTISRIARFLGTLVLVFIKVKAIPLLLGFRLLIDFATLVYMWWKLKPQLMLIKIDEFVGVSQQTWTFGIAEILNFVYDRADLTLLAFLTLNKSEISYYGTALNIAFAGIAILQTLQNVLVPYIIKHQKERPPSQRLRLYTSPMLLLVGAGLSGSMALFFFGEKITGLLLGSAYQTAGPLLTLVSPLIMLKAINVALSSFLIARQNQELKLLPLAIVTLLKPALILLFFNQTGLRGMIIIFMICEFILLILYSIQLFRSVKLNGHKAEKQSGTELR